MSWAYLVKMNLKVLKEMDKYKVQKLFKDIYQIVDEGGDSLYKGSISNCYAWIRIMEINILEE